MYWRIWSLWIISFVIVASEYQEICTLLQLDEYSGVNICPKKSETVYPKIWGILKLSGLIIDQ